MASSNGPHPGSAGSATRWRLELEGRPRDVTISAEPGATQPCVARGGAPEPVIDAARAVVTVTFPRRIRRSGRELVGLALAPTFGWAITATREVQGLHADLTGIAFDGVEFGHAVVGSSLALPHPRGTVPVRLGAGAAELTIERPRGVAARVQVGAGVHGLTLDGSDFGAVGGSTDWQSADYDRSADRYLISIAKGAKNVSVRMVDREPASLARRLLATVLFTDIVGSTERASELGDRRWSELLDLHDRLVTQHVVDAGGRVVKRTGDGMLARFEQPGDAISAAVKLRAALAERGIHIRAGLHTGEIEVREDDVVGIAVHLASRIEAEADPDEVLVSRTVRDLVTGASFVFEDRGVHSLKGIDGDWRLFAVGAP